jgi:hypothetical protein
MVYAFFCPKYTEKKLFWYILSCCWVRNRSQRYRKCDLVVKIKSTQWQEKDLGTELQFIGFTMNIIWPIVSRICKNLTDYARVFLLLFAFVWNMDEKIGEVFYARSRSCEKRQLRHACPRGTTLLPMDVFSWNLIRRFF